MAAGFFIEDEVDVVVLSLGCNVNPIIPSSDAELKVNQWGIMQVDDDSLMTNKTAVFAGGDVITGGSTVINAMGQGKKAAKGIHAFLS